jgi:hypothetical protein
MPRHFLHQHFLRVHILRVFVDPINNLLLGLHYGEHREPVFSLGRTINQARLDQKQTLCGSPASPCYDRPLACQPSYLPKPVGRLEQQDQQHVPGGRN